MNKCSDRTSTTTRRRVLTIPSAVALLVALALPLAACGGGGGSGGATPGDGSLALLSFEQDGIDNMPLNTILEIRFAEAVDPASVSAASVQVRAGPSFGATVPGVFLVEGSTVWFEPKLPGLCDLSDGGFQPSTNYRLQVIGFPEEFSVRNVNGQPWLTQTDLSIRQNIPIPGRSHFQISVDIMNFWNLIDEESGHVRFMQFGTTRPYV